MKLGEIGGLRRPGGHLGIDVDRVLRAPGWIEGFVPDSLKIRRESSWAATGHEHVAAVLKVGRDESGIFPSLFHVLDAGIGGNIAMDIGSKIDSGTVGVSTVVRDVT